MDQQRFDEITTTLGQTPTRRGALRLLGVAALSATGLTLLVAGDGEARRRKKKRRKGKKNQRCLKSGERCNTDGQCCGGGLICDVPHGASNSDTACCGGQGATCGGVDEEGNALPPFCCVGEAGVRSFICSQNDPNTPNVAGTCIPAPEE
jgi:hypothetical protein